LKLGQNLMNEIFGWKEGEKVLVIDGHLYYEARVSNSIILNYYFKIITTKLKGLENGSMGKSKRWRQRTTLFCPLSRLEKQV